LLPFSATAVVARNGNKVAHKVAENGDFVAVSGNRFSGNNLLLVWTGHKDTEMSSFADLLGPAGLSLILGYFLCFAFFFLT